MARALHYALPMRWLPLLVMMLDVGCGPGVIAGVVDTVTIRDPSQVTVVASNVKGRVETGDGASTDYEVTVVQRADGPEVHWQTGAALYNGDHHKVLTTNALRFTEANARDAPTSWDAKSARFRAEGCTYVAEVHTGGGYYGHMPVPVHHLGYEIRADVPCARGAGQARVPFVIETPWSNVAIERTVSHRRFAQGTVAIMGGNAMYFGIFPAVVGAATQTPVAEGVGIGISAAGLATLLTAWIFLPSDSWTEKFALPTPK